MDEKPERSEDELRQSIEAVQRNIHRCHLRMENPKDYYAPPHGTYDRRCDEIMLRTQQESLDQLKLELKALLAKRGISKDASL